MAKTAQTTNSHGAENVFVRFQSHAMEHGRWSSFTFGMRHVPHTHDRP
jgi:hypothetical protein